MMHSIQFISTGSLKLSLLYNTLNPIPFIGIEIGCLCFVSESGLSDRKLHRISPPGADLFCVYFFKATVSVRLQINNKGLLFVHEFY